MGWRMRHGVDVGTTTLLVLGGLAATVVHVSIDVLIHRHRSAQ